MSATASVPRVSLKALLPKAQFVGANDIVLSRATERSDLVSRGDLFALFSAAGYGVVDLPWVPGQATRCLKGGSFVRSGATNFGAVPIERIPCEAADLRQGSDICLV